MKRRHSLLLFGQKATDIYVLFAACPIASIEDNILMWVFPMMDDTIIVQRGVNTEDYTYYPSVIFDNHITWIEEECVS